ncbi:AAA family ATPase [Methylovulum psychrotolerans]|nr:AAA family ATPase [Methylovulum psychrotolerans]
MAQVTKYALLKKEIHALSVTLDTLVSVADNDALMKGLLANVEPHISELKKIVENPTEYLFSAISNSFANALKDNFQISNLADLKNYRSAADDLAQFDFAQLGSVTLKKAALTVALNPDSFAEFRQFNTIVYLESPVYWKMAAALQSVRQDKRQLSMYGWQKINYLTGVPRYVYDLLDQLSHKRKISHPIGLDQDTINAAIGGEIKLSESGDFYFQEHGYADGVGLHSTALGITNLGLISLLLKRGVLGEGSCLFIDEPEAHLHPSWQKVMVEALFELSTKGVNIIIASHSIDMMKCIENIMEREQDNLDLDAHFGINQLSADGNSVNMSDNVFKRIAAIKEDLGQSFYEMFVDSAWLG